MDLEPGCALREQARSHRGMHSSVGAGLLAKRPIQPPLQWLCTPDQSVTMRECFWVSFMVMYTSNDTAMHAVTYQ